MTSRVDLVLSDAQGRVDNQNKSSSNLGLVVWLSYVKRAVRRI